jgi:hypothetical protein
MSSRPILARRPLKGAALTPAARKELPMSMKKFLIVNRSPADRPSAKKPSPEEMQAAMAKFQAWKAQFAEEIVDVGDALKPGGIVYRNGAVTDGPFIEGKEVMGGYMIVATASIERAVDILKACPIHANPDASFEIREMARY